MKPTSPTPQGTGIGHSDDVSQRMASASCNAVDATPLPHAIRAYLLALQHDDAEPQHYGLFRDEHSTLTQAQQHQADWLIAKLPICSHHPRIGINVRKTTARLQQQGYDAHYVNFGIDSNSPTSNPMYSSASPVFPASDNRECFDTLVLCESIHSTEPLIAINQAFDRLPIDGDLLIMDEFVLRYDATETVSSFFLDNMITLAERLGFKLIEQIDLSDRAAPTLAYWQRAIQIHRQKLRTEHAVTDEQWTQFDQFYRRRQLQFSKALTGYVYLHFKKLSIPKWRVQLLHFNQMPDMLALFKKTFQHDMTPTTWQWKYGAHAGCAIGVWRDHQLIAHYGGIGRRILFFGKPQTAVQISDVMVDVAERGTLSKKGPFFLATATFLEHYIGYGKPYLLGFGFPSERHMKIAEHLGQYARVGNLIEFSWSPRPRYPHWRTKLQPIDDTTPVTSEAIVNSCWQHMVADMQNAIIGVRDWEYVQRRYLHHPSQSYRVLMIKSRFSQRVEGILVLRYDATDCEIMDFIAPLRAIPIMIHHARRLAGMHGCARVFCHITENFADHFAKTGGFGQPAHIPIPANIWSPGPAPEILKNHWWLMSGDKDFR